MNRENWYKVDNVAKVFLATHTEQDTRSLRVSCSLYEPVDPALLEEALMATIKARPLFQVRIRRGFFWHYIEGTDQLPMVAPESERPCPVLYGKNYKGVLHYSVTYFRNRINVELFHALSDGTGALEFLNILVLNYLRKKYPNELADASFGQAASAGELEQDSYDKFYDHKGKANPVAKKAYHIRGLKLPYNQLQFFEIQMPTEKVLKTAKDLGVSLTSYMGAKLMMAIYHDMPTLKQKLPVTISMPVNLRNFYPSETARNFFNSVSVSHTFTGKETIEELAKEFDGSLKANLKPEHVHQQMAHYQRIQRLVFIRVIPLALKQPVVKYFSKQEAKRVSAVVSNLGVMKVPKELSAYIKDYSAFCSHTELFMTICSYDGHMTLGVTSSYRNTSVLKEFVRSFAKEDIPVKLQATEVVRS